MSIFDVVTIDLGLRPAHPACGFERADSTVQFGITQPEQCRHRRSVEQERRVANHHRLTLWATYDHDEVPTWRPPKKAGDRNVIRFVRLILGQG